MSWILRRHRWLAMGLAVLAAWVVQAQALPDAAAVGRFARELLDRQRIDPKGPGIAVLIARGDRVLLKTARGRASIELGVPLSAGHRFRIGSVTKQVAAATLLHLVDEGRASLEDPLSKYLPDYPNGHAITLAMLLNHTSGVKSYTGIEGYMGNPVRRDMDTTELIRVFKDLPVDFAPGDGWAYNNSGYVLVGAVIEAITRKPWWLTATTLPSPLFHPDPKQIVPAHASGYTREGVGPWLPADLISMTQPKAAGALVGDLDSLWRWNRMLHEGSYLMPATYRRMTTPEGAAVASGYGFGLVIGTLRGERIFQHSGGIHGFKSMLQYLPAPRISVVLLRNADDGMDLGVIGRQLAAFAAGKPFPKPASFQLGFAQLKAFEGVYTHGKDSQRLRVVGDRLTSQKSDASPVALLPVGPSRFLLHNDPAQVEIERAAGGVVTGLRWYPEGDGDGKVWERTGDLPGHSP